MAHVSVIRGIEVGLIDRISAFLKSLSDSRQRYRVYRQTVRELSVLTERELADLGISRYSIERVAMEAAYGK